MKKITIATLAILLGVGAMAQTEPVKPDTTDMKFGDTRIIMIDEKPDSDSTDIVWEDDDEDTDKYTLTHWGGLDLGVNILLNKDGGTAMDSANTWLELDYSRSLSWRINLFEEKIRFYKDYVGLIVGAGFTYNSYGLKNNVNVMTEDSSATYAFTVPDSVIDYSKNKLRASYINVPLMLEINTSDDNDKCFHIAAGVIGGWKMGSLVRQKWEDGDDKNSYRRKADYNLNPFTLDATARIGYKDFTLFATYGLTPLFKKDKGPEVYPVTVGLQIVPF
ncbi:MAG: outer membrane beta-barrel protein [Flavobacteriales bacterium]